MPQTPDRRPGALEEDDEIRLTANLTPPTTAGALNYNGTVFQLRDAAGIFDPRAGGGGLTPATHEALDTLVHNIARSNDGVVSRTLGLISSVVQYQPASLTLKVREAIITRTSGLISQVQVRQYADDGTTVLQTITRVYTRTNGLVSSFVDTVT